MGAGQSWRKLNGDQDDRRANKLPDISVRVHQAHDIRGSRHCLASREGWLMCGAEFFIFQSSSDRQWFTRPDQRTAHRTSLYILARR
jgi:hypothetical protein